jgi:hypothetical protein
MDSQNRKQKSLQSIGIEKWGWRGSEGINECAFIF